VQDFGESPFRTMFVILVDLRIIPEIEVNLNRQGGAIVTLVDCHQFEATKRSASPFVSLVTRFVALDLKSTTPPSLLT